MDIGDGFATRWMNSAEVCRARWCREGRAEAPEWRCTWCGRRSRTSAMRWSLEVCGRANDRHDLGSGGYKLPPASRPGEAEPVVDALLGPPKARDVGLLQRRHPRDRVRSSVQWLGFSDAPCHWREPTGSFADEVSPTDGDYDPAPAYRFVFIWAAETRAFGFSLFLILCGGAARWKLNPRAG
jgi:hypothetical protein